jgi:biopolymer transport protein ExbD
MARKMRSKAEVELNLASMLDMAFQLLMFFLLTFRPPPVEGQIRMNMPPPQPIVGKPGGMTAGSDDKLDPKEVKLLKTLVITVIAKPNSGQRDVMLVGDEQVMEVTKVGVQVRKLLTEPGTPFEQIIIQASPELEYSELMEVVESCTLQKGDDGKELVKHLSLLPLHDETATPKPAG